MISILGIVLSLGLLILLAFRGLTVLLLAPAMAVLATAFDGGMPLLATYTQIFMRAAANFIAQFFPLFLLGAVFGKLMEDTGSAEALARGLVAKLGAERSILAVVLACAVLTYGGVSLFVVAFAVYPIAAALFRQADIPKRLMPAAIALGSFTFTMSALPGAPAIQNAIPMPFFGTTAFAAPGLGIITALVMLAFGLAWLTWRERSLKAKGEGYGAADGERVKPDKRLREAAQDEGFDLMEIGDHPAPAGTQLPRAWLAGLPVVLVVAVNLIVTAFVLPRLDTAYLAEARFGATDIAAVRGIWAIIAGLLVAITFLIVVNRSRLASLSRTLDDGANASALPIFNTASLVGFGAVIASLGAFATLRDLVLGIGGGSVLISLAFAASVLAGMTGSASGGMTIALQALGATYLEMGQAAGIAPDLLHRVTTVATGVLDTLPHNGAVITLLAICRLKHGEAYGDIAMTGMIGPLLSLVVLIGLGSLFGSF